MQNDKGAGALVKKLGNQIRRSGMFGFVLAGVIGCGSVELENRECSNTSGQGCATSNASGGMSNASGGMSQGVQRPVCPPSTSSVLTTLEPPRLAQGWFVFNGGNTIQLGTGIPNSEGAEMIPGGRDGSQYAAHTHGQTLTKASLGYQQNCVDASAFKGFSFWARGSVGAQNRVKVAVGMPSTQSVEWSGACTSGCFDFHETTIVVSSVWEKYTVTWGELVQPPTTTPDPFEPNVMDVFFGAVAEAQDSPTSFDIWIDDVELVSR